MRIAKHTYAVFLILGALWAADAPAASPDLSVCDAVRRGDELDGKTVRIKGVWREASSGAGLFDELVDESCPGIEIHVVVSAEGFSSHPPPRGYKLDVKTARNAQHVAEKALADGRDLSATILGVVYEQKREHYIPARQLENGVILPPHHKWYPLVLLVKAVPEIKER